jgi:hypothetical protein
MAMMKDRMFDMTPYECVAIRLSKLNIERHIISGLYADDGTKNQLVVSLLRNNQVLIQILLEIGDYQHEFVATLNYNATHNATTASWYTLQISVADWSAALYVANSINDTTIDPYGNDVGGYGHNGIKAGPIIHLHQAIPTLSNVKYATFSTVFLGGIPDRYTRLLSAGIIFQSSFVGEIAHFDVDNDHCMLDDGYKLVSPTLQQFSGVQIDEHDVRIGAQSQRCTFHNATCMHDGVCIENERRSLVKCDCRRTYFDGERCEHGEFVS